MNSSNPYRKKLVIIVSRFPFPLEKGDKLRAFHQIKELSSTYSITLITTTDSKVSKESIDSKYSESVKKELPYEKELRD